MHVLQAYLAGPDVFLPDAAAFSRRKQRLCTKYDFVGLSPIDNEIDISRLSKRDAAQQISSANEEMIRKSDLVIANVTPFRGPSADVGTAYEMGFARALQIPVFAYTTVAGTLLERTRDALSGFVIERPLSEFEDSDHMLIENFDCFDNLMLAGAVWSTGAHVIVRPARKDSKFTDLTAFEECLKVAAHCMSLRAGALGAHGGKF